MSEPLLIFNTNAGFNSILTADKNTELSDDSPNSVFGLAKKYELPEINIVDDNIFKFIEIYKNGEAAGVKVCFGLKLEIFNDEDDNGSKIIIWILNTQGYYDLLKLYGVIGKEKFCWSMLKKYITANIQVVIPFYDSFIYYNLMRHEYSCIPSFLPKDTIFLLEDKGLPIDDMLNNKVMQYCAINKYNTLVAYTVKYYLDKDFIPYMCYKTIKNRKTMSKPNMDFCCSDSFSFESYFKLCKKTI